VYAKPKKNSTSYSVRSTHKETTMNNSVPYIWRKNYCNNGPWPEKVLQTAHENARQYLNRAATSSTRYSRNVDDGAV